MFGKKKINIEDDMEHKNHNDQESEENQVTDGTDEEMTENQEEHSGSNAQQSKHKKEMSDAEKLAELNDKYLRLHADFENFRRRTNKEKSDLLQYGNKELLLKILPVYDDFERGLEIMQKSEGNDSILDGIKLIFNKFTSILQQAGLKEIEATGHDFDPELHEAITKIQMSPDMKGKVVDQVQKGYLLNDKIIRHSKVVVGE
jgi:molecular chaperone GrpE